MEDQSPLWIIIVSLLIGAIGLALGLSWLRARRAAKPHGHLEADIAEPETLADRDR